MKNELIEQLKNYKIHRAKLKNLKIYLEIAEREKERQRLSESIQVLSKQINALDKALESLDSLERNMLNDFYIEGQRWADVAEKVGYSIRSCKNFRDKALKKVCEFTLKRHSLKR